MGEEGAPDYTCPANVEPELEKKLKHFAWRAHILLNALDISRTDIRLDDEGSPRLMEINTLPGLTPDYSDLCLQANAEGIAYNDLLLEILYLAAGAGDCWSRARFRPNSANNAAIYLPAQPGRIPIPRLGARAPDPARTRCRVRTDRADASAAARRGHRSVPRFRSALGGRRAGKLSRRRAVAEGHQLEGRDQSAPGRAETA